MAEWLRLPSGEYVNMDRVVLVSEFGPRFDQEAREIYGFKLRMAGSPDVEVVHEDAAAIGEYLHGKAIVPED